jgi:nucleoporin NUP159
LRLSTPWSPPPAPNASLMSIASRRGLVAAAGPDAVVVASTDAVRKAFESPKDGDSEVRAFSPQLKLPLPIRICQLVFSVDEAYLILSAEQGGGLAVYDVNTLQNGTTQPTFEISTMGESLRALVPNPSTEKAELCAVVTTEGKLLMANLNERNFVSGGNGQVLQDQVSCVAWSTKGKQLVAGLGDGTMRQLTPEGVVKAEIPRPPELDPSFFGKYYVHVLSSRALMPYSLYGCLAREQLIPSFPCVDVKRTPDEVPHNYETRPKLPISGTERSC